MTPRDPLFDLGVFALDLTTGRSWTHHADLPMPMASIRKLAIAGKFLQELSGTVSQAPAILGTRVSLYPTQWCPGSGSLAKRLIYEGTSVSAADLFRLMLELSDNIATDEITRWVGVPHAVTQWLESKGIRGMRLDRNSMQLKLDYDAIRGIHRSYRTPHWGPHPSPFKRPSLRRPAIPCPPRGSLRRPPPFHDAGPPRHLRHPAQWGSYWLPLPRVGLE